MMKKIILASGSPRRKQILELAEINFEVILVPTDESYPPGLSPANVSMHIAENKALAVSRIIKEDVIIIAADTIVVLDNVIIGKPKDRTDAINILSALSGKTHEVITGVSIFNGNEKTNFYDIAKVEFKTLSNTQIEHYVDTAKPYDKAGAYAIQEWIGVIGIKSIEGDYYNVMGLPINRIFDTLDITR